MKQLLLDCKDYLRVAIEHNTFKKYLLTLHHTVLYTSPNHTILLVKLSDIRGTYYISIKKDISDIYHYVDKKEYNYNYTYTNSDNNTIIVNTIMTKECIDLLENEIVTIPILTLNANLKEYLFELLEEANPNYNIVGNTSAIGHISINTICEMFNDRYTFEYDNKAQVKIGDSLYFVTQYESTIIFLCVEEKDMYPFLVDNEVKYLNINLYNQYWKGKTDYYPIYPLNTPITILFAKRELQSRINKLREQPDSNKYLLLCRK